MPWDTQGRGGSEGWASDAVEEFLEENDTFVADHSRERFLLTNCPSSWLKRAR